MNELKKDGQSNAVPATVAPGVRERGPVPGGLPATVVETGGPAGPEPTRYGDWERRGRCIDF